VKEGSAPLDELMSNCWVAQALSKTVSTKALEMKESLNINTSLV
jgi:hypothetical protein